MLSWMKRSRSVDLILISVSHWVEYDNAQGKWKWKCHGQVMAAWAYTEIAHCSPRRLCFTLQIKSAQCGSACVRALHPSCSPLYSLSLPHPLSVPVSPFSLLNWQPVCGMGGGGGGLDPPSRLCVCVCVCVCVCARKSVFLLVGCADLICPL